MIFIFLLNNYKIGKRAPERHVAHSSYETSACCCWIRDNIFNHVKIWCVNLKSHKDYLWLWQFLDKCTKITDINWTIVYNVTKSLDFYIEICDVTGHHYENQIIVGKIRFGMSISWLTYAYTAKYEDSKRRWEICYRSIPYDQLLINITCHADRRFKIPHRPRNYLCNIVKLIW